MTQNTWGDGRDGLPEAVHLAAEKRALVAEYSRVMAEVERLQRSAEGWERTALLAEQNKADREAEVERLRYELDWTQANLKLMTEERDRLRRIEEAARDVTETWPGHTAPPWLAMDALRAALGEEA